MLRRLFAALLIALLALPGIAHAKLIPVIEPLDGDWGGLDDPFGVEQGLYYLGLFGRLAEADDVDVLALTFARAAYDMQTSLLVPVCGDEFAEFYPTVAIIGPGLDPPDAETLADLPFDAADLPPDAGVLVFPYEPEESGARPVAEWGLFKQGHYVELVFETDIPQAGDYLFAIWSPADAASPGATGAYTLMTGALHPDQKDFPPDMDLNATFSMVERGAWIGWDCAD